jgi:N-succinyldiaminopimelate aminotransferase
MAKVLSSKIASIQPSIFSIISAKANELGAVNLGQGFPDYDCDDFVKQAAIDAINSGHNQYAPSQGTAYLRSAIAEHEQKFYGLVYNPNTNITVTSGATEALWTTFQAILNDGDEVIVIEPAYDSYAPCITFAGGKYIPCKLVNDSYELDVELLRSLVTQKTTAILFTNPHNPTGKVFSKEELSEIVSVALSNKLYIVCDEVYEHLTYDCNHTPVPMLFDEPEVKDLVVRISSLGKTFSVTGWKIGWVLANETITSAIRAVHQFIVFSVSTPMQIAAAKSLTFIVDNPEDITNYAKSLQQKRDTLITAIETIGLEPYVPMGGYFVMANFSKIYSGTSTEYCQFLLEKQMVATIPIEPFYSIPSSSPSAVRFCFSKKDETIQSAISNLLQHHIAMKPIR